MGEDFRVLVSIVASIGLVVGAASLTRNFGSGPAWGAILLGSGVIAATRWRR